MTDEKEIPEYDIMEDWIIVQPCPVCGFERLTIGEATYVPHYKPLQWVYKCTNGYCPAAGTFGYQDRSKAKEIVMHFPPMPPVSTTLCVSLLMPILPGFSRVQVTAAVNRARTRTDQTDTAKVKLQKIMRELGADEAVTRKAVAFIENVKNETESG